MQSISDLRADRLRRWIRLAYRIADTDAAYPKLDALLFAGDLTVEGTFESISDFWRVVQSELRGDTAVMSVLAKNHDNWSEGRACVKTGLSFYRSVTGLPTDYRTVIGGCSFIGLSTCAETGVYYAEPQREWLRTQLSDALCETPGKPIFVMHHEHVSNTVYGSYPQDGWGMDFFRDIFDEFPQVVHLSGHSHYPINDPRSVWQGTFTAVGCGALSYAELTVDGQNKIHPPGHEMIAQGWIAELDADNRLRLRGYDALTDSLLCEYLLDLSDVPRSFSLTPEEQRARAAAPEFPQNAELSVERSGGQIALTVPEAVCPDGSPVFLYRVSLSDRNGAELLRTVLYNEYWRKTDAASAVSFPAPPGVYAVYVRAENAFGMQSALLSKILKEGDT